jgi:hypothetical protein
VDLYQAMKIVGSQVYLRGRSNQALVRRVRRTPNFVASAKTLSPASGLQHGIALRPFEALHLLSYVTRPRYQDDLLDVYAQWGLMRYLGFFELACTGNSLPGLEVSEAGQRIVGNQRRVTSEEMGVGFGGLLAIHWFAQTGAAGVPISIVDIDAALDDRYIYAAGSRRAVRTVGTRRPDYLIIAHDPSVRSRYRVRALECKGTRSPDYAVRQLASAVEQLGGITVGGRIPAGLAVSTITANDQISYLAIDPDDEEEPSYEVTSNTIERVGSFQLGDEDMSDVSPTELTNASVRASWATLADFGGNLNALDRWAPAVMRRRLDRRSRDRVSFETPFGTARGTIVTFGFDGSRLTVRYAIDETIDQQISQGAAESVTEAQAAFAQRLPSSQNLAQPTGPYELYSATADGSIFSLSLE